MTTKITNYGLILEDKINLYDFPKAPENLYDSLRYFLKLGGKRIRPILTILAAEMFGASVDKSIAASLSIELFHNFSLIHDDIMDEAPLRRGKATVHEKWNTNIAILSGDALLIKAYQEICTYESKILPDLLHVFNKTALEVCAGQQMDMDFEEKSSVSIPEYIEMIRLKTSVLLGCALEMGAIVAETNIENRKQIYTFGQEIGIAFQIQDDILDLYADPDKFGKQVGGDVISDKKTILYLLALEKANPIQKSKLFELKNHLNQKEKVQQTKILFNEIGIKNLAEKQMQIHYENALSAMSKIDVKETKKIDLLNLAKSLLTREN
jgi:geranylgeranyl diphosphate synthase, type II